MPGEGGPQVPRGRWCPGRGRAEGQARVRVPSGVDESRLHSAPRAAAGVGGRLRAGATRMLFVHFSGKRAPRFR